MKSHEDVIKSRVKHEGNVLTLIDFVSYSVATGIGRRRIDRYIDALSPLSNDVGKPFKEMCKADIQGYVRKLLERDDYKEWTKYTYQIIIKNCFFPWLYGTERPDFPEVVKWMKPKVPNRNNKRSEDMLTEEEVVKMMSFANNLRDRAMIAFLFDTGCRVGELMNLRIKDIQSNGDVTHVTLNGKTGLRKIPIMNSIPYLTRWIEQHPARKNPKAKVFCALMTNHEKALSYNIINQILRKVADKSGIVKKVNPHNFRHSQATLLAGKLKEPQLRMYFGWSGDSKMVNTYVHLSSEHLTDAFLEAHGKRKKEETKESALKPKGCPRCQEINGIDARICVKCGMGLDKQTCMKMVREERSLRYEVEELRNNMSMFVQFFKNEYPEKYQEISESLVK